MTPRTVVADLDLIRAALAAHPDALAEFEKHIGNDRDAIGFALAANIGPIRLAALEAPAAPAAPALDVERLADVLTLRHVQTAGMCSESHLDEATAIATAYARLAAPAAPAAPALNVDVLMEQLAELTEDRTATSPDDEWHQGFHEAVERLREAMRVARLANPEKP